METKYYREFLNETRLKASKMKFCMQIIQKQLHEIEIHLDALHDDAEDRIDDTDCADENND